MKLITVICLDNYYLQFYRHSCKSYNNGFLSLIRLQIELMSLCISDRNVSPHAGISSARI
jgi:hypothetical protein